MTTNLASTPFAYPQVVSRTSGLNVFICEGDRVYRSYFINGRGIEEVGPVWSFLDITPLDRKAGRMCLQGGRKVPL
jgi:predicted dithiol-disulfide oxidoreductase (DUF899 family)